MIYQICDVMMSIRTRLGAFLNMKSFEQFGGLGLRSSTFLIKQPAPITQ